MSNTKIIIHNLNRKYGNRHVLKNLNIEIVAESGMIVGIVGINGAGKSTLFRILALIDGDFEGELELVVNNKKIASKFDVGFLPEERSLPSTGKVFEILRLWAELRGFADKQRDELIEKWLNKADLVQYRNSFVKSLSKGNRQKLQLACCLMHSPSFIVFDEPFSGLDPANQELVINLLQERQAEGALILLSAHQLELVERMCDSAYLLNDGTLNLIDSRKFESKQIISIRVNKDDHALEFLKRFPLNDNVYSVPENTLSINEKEVLFDACCSNKVNAYYGKFMTLREQYIYSTGSTLYKELENE
ncbi:hypothetical protein CWB58_18845 [Pseudoalteromonas sp. S201]|jgi:ABC-2 type transport system ATP-binding protein|uniref:ABC transporter ATP-binding protein n=1 Tax=Pseudoalteromonas sp. S201 TaxID=579519 RepID=UPI00110D15F2|nr:ATP-binding cassette domain-containing protein [Pseudoalteromonas sp. S201]TMS91558.1 hypothetical protein CWB58_18845 [Pseudoalteromonas sp. S201]